MLDRGRNLRYFNKNMKQGLELTSSPKYQTASLKAGIYLACCNSAPESDNTWKLPAVTQGRTAPL